MAEGGSLTYTITVHNNGPNDAPKVVLTDVLAPNVRFVSANFGTASVAISGNTVTVSLGTVANGATVQGTIVVEPLEEGTLSNLASVSSNAIDPNLNNNSQTATTTVFDPAVVGTSAKVSATAGAPFSGPVATFTDPGGAEPNPADPSGTIDNHYQVVSIDWGDGTALDTISGTLRYSGSPGSKTAPFTIGGSHTYAADASYTITILIKHEGVITTVTSPAMVVRLGLFIGPRLTKPINFWAGLLGQELITRFGLTSGGQTVGQWLATTLPKLYGGRNGAPNLSTFSNAQVAAFYTTLFNKSTMPKLDAKVLATALDIYATTLSLGGTLAQSYGFTVSTVGLGAYSIDIGLSGPALGVPNHTVLNVFQVLMATNNSAVGGEPWDTDTMRRNQLLGVFNRITG